MKLFFEGSEKKVELVFKGTNLIELGREFWVQVVEKSQAQILSEISTEHCVSYLLSESSLFVWKDKFTMITCGETTLVHAVEFFIEKMGSEDIEFLTYERKNEYRPEQQKTCFNQDVELLKKLVPGKAYQFGESTGHHLYLFHMDRAYEPPADDVTLEILMYGLDGNSKKAFGGDCESAEQARKLTGVDNIFPDFQVDDFLFEPCGYSMNALRGDEYYTIHVTPQEVGAYVSFETNVRIDHNYLPVLQRVIEVFQPKDFDIIVFRTAAQEFLTVPGYTMSSAVKHESICGYQVNHCEFKGGHASVEDVNQSQVAQVIGEDHE